MGKLAEKSLRSDQDGCSQWITNQTNFNKHVSEIFLSAQTSAKVSSKTFCPRDPTKSFLSFDLWTTKRPKELHLSVASWPKLSNLDCGFLVWTHLSETKTGKQVLVTHKSKNHTDPSQSQIH